MSMIVESGITYKEEDGFRFLDLDVYRPAEQTGPLPLIHYIHGGGWRVSDRRRTPRETRGWTPGLFEQIVDAGFVVVASEYRFSGEALYPAAIEDTADALRFARANHERFGVDPGKVVLFGQSAGGYLAAAIGLGTEVEPVQGVVCWYPLTDFSGLLDDEYAAGYPSQWLGAPLRDVPELVEQSRLPRLARADVPPTLLQHGTADTMAPFDQSVRLHAAFSAAGAPIELEPVEGAEHFFNGATDDEVRALFARTIHFARQCVT